MVEYLQRCNATNREGDPCKRSAELGTPVCYFHGGKAPQTLAVADRKKKEQSAARIVEILGLPRDIDPHEALIEELSRSAGNVAWLQSVLNDQGMDALTESTMGGRKTSVWYRMWTAERDRLTKVSAECARAGVQERRVSVIEENARQMSQLVRGILHELQIPIDEHVSKVVSDQFAILAIAE
jgi:hypothetical protein